MSITLGANQYGKAEVRLVHVERAGDRHEMADLTVTVTLSGDLAETHLSGDNSAVLPTDTQKNTVYAMAREHGVAEIEAFALRLARHFVAAAPAIRAARVLVERHPWGRLAGTGHSFVRLGGEVRTATAACDGEGCWVVSGIRELTVMNTTGSRFAGFATDRYTTLEPAADRILATAVDARWRHARADPPPGGWDGSYAAARERLLEAFATTYSHSLQQTLYAMGRAVLDGRAELCEIRLALPNRHHFLVDLEPFGLANEETVYHPADRPYGLIEGTVRREPAPPPGLAWW